MSKGRKKRKTTAVHPNSMAARKWGRTRWWVKQSDYFEQKLGPGAYPKGDSQPEG